MLTIGMIVLGFALTNICAKPLNIANIETTTTTASGATYLTAEDFERANLITEDFLNVDDNRQKPWVQTNKAGGDYSGQAADIKRGIDTRNGVKSERDKWPGGVIPYEISAKYSANERAVIAKAMQSFHDKTCIQFVPRTNQHDYIYIAKIDGCYSDVGRVRGRQDVSLDDGCVTYDTAIHELMHAVGFWHEHERFDRDDYISVLWQNVERSQFDQFGKENLFMSDYYGESYDYTSIMHYDSKSFSKNGQDTMQAKVASMTNVIGRVKDFSAVDVRKINKMYRCPNHH